MLLIEYVGRIGLRSLTDGHLGHHFEYFKTLNDAREASVGFIKYNASTTTINKEKNFKIKFQVILVFYSRFYKLFWNDVKEFYINSINYPFQTGSLTDLQKKSIITLIPQQNKDITSL